MTSRLAARCAAAVLALALLGAEPAGAQSCRPSSAELAIEELLDVAADGSPLEEQARAIVNQQDAKDAFETPETITRLDELARANHLVYQCERRRYVPVSRPDPREAIAQDQEPVDEGPDGVSATPPVRDPGAGGVPGTSSGSSVPGRPGVDDDSISESSDTVGEGATGAQDDGTGAGRDGAGAEAGSGSGLRADGARSSRSGSGTRNDGPRSSRSGTPGAGEDEIGAPTGAPDGEGGAVALPGEDGVPDGRPALAVGAAAAIGIVALFAAGAARRRPRALP